MTNSSVEKTYCLRVSKDIGQKARDLTVKLGLLNRAFKIQTDDGNLFIPLNDQPVAEQKVELEKILPQFGFVVRELPRRIEYSRNIFEILDGKLPPNLLASLPRSIDIVGNIAVVEILEELNAHKKIVGEAIIVAHKHVRTVLAKSTAVSGIYRTREYEVIAGSPTTETVHQEHGCKYHLDLSKAYFSPRLSYEHQRVALQVQENETVIDMFAGVGPFSILIAKTREKVTVYAIDINPDAVEYLKKNILANGVQGKVRPIFGDAHAIIQDRLCKSAERLIMNLPEKAAEYLEMACDAIKPEGGIVHYYAFAKGPVSLESEKDNLVKAVKQTGHEVEEFLSARFVREVAPFKWQIALDVRIS